MTDSEYHGGDYIFVSADKEISESVRLHEISHQILMKSTHWGMMTYLQIQFRRADKLLKRAKNNMDIGNLLMQAAENVFESHALFNQLLYAKNTGVEEFSVLKKGPYYKLYNQKYFDILLSLDLPINEVAYLSQSISELALAIDLIEVDPKWWKSKDSILQLVESDAMRYNPDVRFESLIKTYMYLLKKYKPQQITKTMLAETSGLYIKVSQYDTPMQVFYAFAKLMRQVYNDTSAKEALKLIKKTLVEGEMEDIINEANALDIPLPTNKIETFTLSKYESWLNECQVLKFIPYEEKVILEYYITEFAKRYIIACNWDALHIFYAKYNKTILLYSEDYYYMKDKFPYLKDRRVFYYFEGSYKYFCEYIKDKSVMKIPTFLYKVNECTFVIFVKGKLNEIFFTAQNIGGVKLFIEDIQKGKYEYINFKDEKVDDIFYIDDVDWAVYDDVVKSVLHVNRTCGRCELT